MPSALTPQNLKVAPNTPLELNQIQGDVLIGLQKLYERFVFFEIKDTAAFKATLKNEIAHRITTARTVQLREFQLRDHKSQGGGTVLPNIGVNLGFTADGIGKLVPEAQLGDPAFAAGARQRAGGLGDAVDAHGNPRAWVREFLRGAIDGVFLIAGGSKQAIDDEAARLLGILGTSVGIVYDETGNVRPGHAKGHEHFGWLDGVSQPGIDGLSDPFPGQRLLDPGLFVFGYGRTAAPALPWMRNGSLMVFRRLKQLVPEFDQYLLAEAKRLGMDPVLLGARLVGRWKSGAPLALAPSQDDGTMGGDPQRNNAFDFADDTGERRCPFGAHIRKTNPRADLFPQPLDVDPHRLIRAGIPFGPEVTAAEAQLGMTERDRGLLFVCYQTSIPNQFEFVQINWANDPAFAHGKSHPDGSPAAPGFDAIIGQNAGKDPTVPPPRGRFMDEPVPNYPTGNLRSRLDEADDFVIATGGGYFFMPAIAALENQLSR